MGRNELTLSTWRENLKRAGAPYDLYITDQGGAVKDQDFKKDLQALGPKYLRDNLGNEGIARSLNQMMIRNPNPFFFFMPPDILLPENWLKDIAEAAQKVPKAGIIGFLGQGLKLPKKEVPGLTIYTNCLDDLELTPQVLENSQVLGAIGWSFEVVNKIGFFCEAYHPYGWEDADYCFRAQIAGFTNFLIDSHSDDLGNDYHSNTMYSEIKKFMSLSNIGLHRWRAANYHVIGLYEPAPIPKPPCV
jgi:GT2 family glycosyltransferase